MIQRAPRYSVGFIVAGLLLAAPTLHSQTSGAQVVPSADRADVESIDAIVLAVYDVISGPAGEQRDWDRMRSLFALGARLIPSGPRQSGGFGHRMLPLEDYISSSGPVLEQNGFFEVEIHRVTEEFGNIAHLFSTYESRRNVDDPEPFVRGINSFQLFNDGERWWILNIFWTDERTAPIPPRYLP